MISDFLQFSVFLEKFRSVERTIRVPGAQRNENDTEHSYMLAMLAWYICVTEKLTLDTNKVIHYALVHDLVEVYAGDVCVYTGDAEAHSSKMEREKEALDRIMTKWKAFPDMIEAMQSYMQQEDLESKFVYALDKLQPMLVSYNGGGEAYRELNVTLEMIVQAKTQKIALDPTIKKYFDALIEIFEKNHERLFQVKK